MILIFFFEVIVLQQFISQPRKPR